MKSVRLRNGSEEMESLVAAPRVGLDALARTSPPALYELWEKAKDRNHVCWGKTAETLEDVGLLVGGHLHSSVKNVVLSALESADGGTDFCLVDPRVADKHPDLDAVESEI